MWPTQVNYGPLGKIVFQKKNYIYSINLKILGPFLNFFLKIKPHFNSNYAKKKKGSWIHAPLALMPQPALWMDHGWFSKFSYLRECCHNFYF